MLQSLRSQARALFNEGVTAVNPQKLIQENVKVISRDGLSYLAVNGTVYNLQSNVFMVGFGKAVLGMAVAIEKLIRPHLRAGILSVPVGTLSDLPNLTVTTPFAKSLSGPIKSEFLNNIQIIECAKNNLPDEEAYMAAQKIADLVESLNSSTILIVLISGGGSALLPLPLPSVSLAEKLNLIKMLSNAGANITDLNCVRKKLSRVKGGGLARLAYPAQVVSLIISDVVGDPIDTIASGPTYPYFHTPICAWEVVQKYKLTSKISDNIKKILTSQADDTPLNFNNVNNVLVGSNSIALAAINSAAQQMGYNSIILSNKIQEIACNVGVLYALLATTICRFWLTDLLIDQFALDCLSIERKLKINFANAKFYEEICSSKRSQKPVCLIFGGETTVHVSGNGIGGRNQELALAFSIDLYQKYKTYSCLKNFEVLLLSAGTDGIDGPTNVAGAIGSNSLICEALSNNIDPVLYLKNNDSYNFFTKLNDGSYFIKTGHTGTNVMDVQIIFIVPTTEINEDSIPYCQSKI